MKEIKITENISIYEEFPGSGRVVIVSDGQTAVLINPSAGHFFSKYPIKAFYAFNSIYETDQLLCGIKAVRLQSQKNEVETVFYLSGPRTLIAGEVLSVKDGKMEMWPEESYSDYAKAQAGLRRLFSLDFEIFIPAKGEIISSGAYEKLENMFEDLK